MSTDQQNIATASMSEVPGMQRTLKASFVSQVQLRFDILDEWIKEKAVPWAVAEDGKQIRDEAGELVPDYAPTNIAQFCAWTGEKNTAAAGPKLIALRSISRESVSKTYHADLRIGIESRVKAVNACLIRQRETANKSSQIAELKEEVKMLTAIVQAQQTESRVARLRLGELTTKYRLKHEEQRRTIAQLNIDLQRERDRVAALTASKISKLRAVKPHGPAS